MDSWIYDLQKIKYPRGDVRRLLRLALVISELSDCRLNRISDATGHHKQTILDDVPRLYQQLGVIVERRDAHFVLVDWGPMLCRESVTAFMAAQ